MLIHFAYEVGLRPVRIASTNGGEYASPCPECGGNDRFRTWPNKQNKNCIGSYWCRKCGISGDSLEFCRIFLNHSFAEAKKRVNATTPENHKLLGLRKKYSSFKPLITNPATQWIIKAEKFVKYAHDAIWNNPEVLQLLEKRGLPEEAIKKYKIGWNLRDLFYHKYDWGLENIESKRNKLWLPKGIVIPFLDQNGVVKRLKIRRQDWTDGDKLGKYIIVPGSMNGLNIFGNKQHKVLVVVESELDALAVCHTVGDFVFAIAVGGCIKNPDNVTNYLAKQKTLFICPDNDEGGAKLLEKWQKLYSHAQPYRIPVGKDIGEAIEQGFDIRAWLSKLKPAKEWSKEDKKLIDWFMSYAKKHPMALAHKPIEREILLGPDNPKAISGELQEGLRLMKTLVDNEINLRCQMQI